MRANVSPTAFYAFILVIPVFAKIFFPWTFSAVNFFYSMFAKELGSANGATILVKRMWANGRPTAFSAL